MKKKKKKKKIWRVKNSLLGLEKYFTKLKDIKEKIKRVRETIK